MGSVEEECVCVWAPASLPPLSLRGGNDDDDDDDDACLSKTRWKRRMRTRDRLDEQAEVGAPAQTDTTDCMQLLTKTPPESQGSFIVDFIII